MYSRRLVLGDTSFAVGSRFAARTAMIGSGWSVIKAHGSSWSDVWVDVFEFVEEHYAVSRLWTIIFIKFLRGEDVGK